MGNDSSLGGQSSQVPFDLDSQAGLMQLLYSVRASKISSSDKNELRDEIFLYINGNRDSGTRASLEAKIIQHQITPSGPTPSIKEKAVNVKPKSFGFGSARPSPTFSAPPASTFTPDETPKKSPEPEPAPKPEPAPVPTPEPVTQKEPVAISPEPAPIIPEPAPVAQEPVASPVNSTGLDRIKEIKSLVNEKVGNPVNLVDIDNTVGREYMAAMLDAMKQISAGSAGTAAMQRLETAFAMVEKTIAEKGMQPSEATSTKTTNDSIEQTAPVSTPAPTPESPPEPVSAPTPAPDPEPRPEPAPTIASEISAPVTRTRVDTVKAPHIEQEESLVNPNQFHNELNSVIGMPANRERGRPSTTVASQPRSINNQISRPARSLADSPVKLKTPENLPDPKSLQTSSIEGDPLYTREVDDGLQQLLVEWPIFNKSGLFGTGPKGREHPLFKKVSGLQIPLLLAGRFEGATQEIKQSITDYMNGWRYEQGIIYQQGETFEHYLRRVIRHILDLQKGSLPS